MGRARDTIPLLGRMLISLIFLQAAYGHATAFKGTEAFMAAHGMPLTGLFLTGAIGLLLAGSLSVLLGYRTAWGVAALVVFLVPTTLIFHTAWSDHTQVVNFLKNTAILGGLLQLAYFGPGPLSLDARRAGGHEPVAQLRVAEPEGSQGAA